MGAAPAPPPAMSPYCVSRALETATPDEIIRDAAGRPSKRRTAASAAQPDDYAFDCVT